MPLLFGRHGRRRFDGSSLRLCLDRLRDSNLLGRLLRRVLLIYKRISVNRVPLVLASSALTHPDRMTSLRSARPVSDPAG